MKNRYISSKESREFLADIIKKSADYEIVPDKQCIDIADDGIEFRLPLTFPKLEQNLSTYLAHVPAVPEPYLVMLIQAGAAALGYFEEGELQYHKVIKKYMVRKSQGKSQIKHLKTKGKSRLGSRIRLRNTDYFFAEIAEKIASWDVINEVKKIFLFCPVNLVSFLYDEKYDLPFQKDDKRIMKVPFDVKIPCFDELLKIDKMINKGRIREI